MTLYRMKIRDARRIGEMAVRGPGRSGTPARELVTGAIVDPSRGFRLAAFGTLGTEFTGQVVGVVDADTILVMRNGCEALGHDCPESHQPFGTRAKQFTSELAFGKIVKVQGRDVDRYGRTVGEVILPDGRNLNRELVRAGLAWWYRQYARGDQDLARLETDARSARRGLWIDKAPVPPWEWRRARTTARSTVREASP